MSLGAVVGPPEAGKKKRKRMIEQLAQDLDPASRDAAIQIYENWKGRESEEELRKLLGNRRVRRLLKDESPEA